MSQIELIIPIALGLAGLAIILFLIKILVLNFIGDPRRWLERSMLRRKSRLLEEADARLATGEHRDVTPLLNRAMVLDLSRLSPALIRFAEEQNSAILSRTMVLFDSLGVSPQNLPIVEELLQGRIKLFTSELEISETLRTLRERRKALGDNSPRWAFDDYSKKLTAVRDQLKTNRRNVVEKLNALFAELSNREPKDAATYH